MQQCEDETQKK